MRKALLFILAALLLSVALYVGIGADSYFLLRIGDWAIQVRLFIALVLLAGFVLVVWAFWSLFKGIILGAWPAAWRRRRENNLTRVAIENLALSNWSSARKDLIRLANQTDKPVPIVMLSAQASEAIGDLEEAKSVYNQVMDEFPEWSYSAHLRLCNIALIEGELSVAQELLDQLRSDRKVDPQQVFLAARLAEEKQDWPALQEILAKAQKKPQGKALVAPVERRFLQTRLLSKPGAPELLEFKSYVSGVDHVPFAVLEGLARQLSMKGHAKEAEVLVRKHLSKHWCDELMELYADLEADSPKRQLKVAEAWVSSHADSEALWEGLQKMAVRAGNEAKADEYAAKLDTMRRARSDDNPNQQLVQSAVPSVM